MSFWEIIAEADRTGFQWINSGCSNAVFDAVLPLCRERLFWAPLYFFVLVFTLFNFRRKASWLVGGILLTVALADFSSSSLLKKNLQRLRPCNDPAMEALVIERVPCGSGYSFTSSHAANHFAVAVFLIGVFGGLSRRVKPVLLFWAGVVAFSQVYVGVHYPGDVLAGALLGSALGWGVYRLGRRMRIFPMAIAP